MMKKRVLVQWFVRACTQRNNTITRRHRHVRIHFDAAVCVVLKAPCSKLSISHPVRFLWWNQKFKF
jgi:hypothetical protein